MRTDYAKAEKLRRKGHTYREISEFLGISRSTLSTWFKGMDWSEKISLENRKRANVENTKRIKAFNEVRKKQLDIKYEKAKKEASLEYARYKNDTLFVAGLMLYVGEGDKSLQNNLVRIANVKFYVHKIFLAFLFKFCDLTKKDVKIWLLLYPDLDESLCKKKWAVELNLKPENFYKSQIIQGRHKTKRLHYGVGNIIIGRKYLKIKILKWIELISQDILQKEADIV